MTASLMILGPSTPPGAAAPTKATGRSAAGADPSVARAKSAASGKASRSPTSGGNGRRAASGPGSDRQAPAGAARENKKAHVGPSSVESLAIFTEVGDAAVLPAQMPKADLTFPAVMARHVAGQHTALGQANGKGTRLVTRAGRPASVAPRTVAQEVIADRVALTDNGRPAAEKAAVLLMSTQPGRPAFSNAAGIKTATSPVPAASPAPAASPELVEAGPARSVASSVAGASPDQAAPVVSSTAQTSAVVPNTANIAAIDHPVAAGHSTPAAARADQAASLPDEPGKLARDPIAPRHTPAAARADRAASLPDEPGTFARDPIAPLHTLAAARADQAASLPDEPGKLARDPIAPRHSTDAANATAAGVQRSHIATDAEPVLPQSNVPDAATATDASPAAASVVRVDGLELTFTGQASPTGQVREALVPADRIIQQISASLAASRASGNQEIVLRLTPPELGRIRLQLTSAGGELRATLEVDNPRTFEEINRQAPALIQRLSDAGLQVKGIDVSLNDPAADQQHADSSDSTLRDPTHAGGQSGNGQAAQGGELSGMDEGEAGSPRVFVERITDQSIDVMM